MPGQMVADGFIPVANKETVDNKIHVSLKF